MVWSLNELSGVSPVCPVSRNFARDRVLDRVKGLVSQDRPPPECPSPEAARSALLGSLSSVYEAPSREATYALDQLSLPPAAGGCPLVDCLEGPDFEDL